MSKRKKKVGRKSEVPGVTCFICREPTDAFFGNYPNPVCRDCDATALRSDGKAPETRCEFDAGDNPVFIRTVQCWRRYRFGGWVTMADPERHEDLISFYGTHRGRLQGRRRGGSSRD